MPCAALPVALALVLAALTGCRPGAPIPPDPVPESPLAVAQGDDDARTAALVGGPRRPVDPPALASAGAEEAAATCSDHPGVRACRVHDGLAHQLGLAEDHGTIAVVSAASGNAWAHDGSPRSQRVSLVLHDRALAPVGEASFSFTHAIRDVSIAPASGGWVLAAAGEQGIELLRLRADGREQGARARVDGATPRLVADAGAPLLIWTRWGQHGVDVFAGPAAQGGLAWETRLFESATEPEFGGQIALSAGNFLIARRAGAGVSVAHLGADGRRQGLHADVGGTTEYPVLAACHDGARMIWSEFGRSPAEVRWARVDGDGRRVGEPVRLSGVPEHFNLAPAICDGVETIVLLTGYTGGTGLSNALDLVRVDPQGRRVGGALRVSGGSMIDPEMVAVDGAVVVAWIAHGARSRVALARVDLAAIGGAVALQAG